MYCSQCGKQNTKISRCPRMSRRLAVVLLCIGAWTTVHFATESRSYGDVPTAPAATPKEAMINMVKGLANGTEAQFLACFDATEQEARFLKSVFAIMKASREFNAAAVAAYGEEGAKKLSGDKSPFPTKDFDKWAETLTINVDGDKATVTSPDQPKPLKLVRKNGAWLIKADDIPQTPEKAETALKTMGVMANVFTKMKARIGQEGVTVESLDKEMNAEMMKAMFGGAMPMPTTRPTTRPATGATAPRKAMANMAKGLVDGTEAQFLACFDATDQEAKFLKSVFAMMKATREFNAAAGAAYGEESAKKLSGSNKSSFPTKDFEKWAETLTIKIEGEKATVTAPDQPKPLELVRKNGAWLIKTSGMAPPPEQAEMATKMMGVMADVFTKMKARIGQEGVTVESLKKEMNAEMTKAMFGGTMPAD